MPYILQQYSCWSWMYLWSSLLSHEKIDKQQWSEFSYKLLHNLLSTNLSVSKWDKKNSGNCDFCGTQENIKHLIFECDLIKPFWSKISQLIKINITWKMIVIGFINFNNKYTLILDNTLSFLACKIYKYKMKCRIVKDQVSYEGVCRFLKNALMQLYFTIKRTKCINLDFRILELLSQNL